MYELIIQAVTTVCEQFTLNIQQVPVVNVNVYVS